MSPGGRRHSCAKYKPLANPAICQELEDALQLLCTKSEDEAAAAAADKRRLEGVVKSLEARLAQVSLVHLLVLGMGKA